MKKNLLSPILAPVLLLLAMLCPTISKADHIAGGELTYRCLGDSQYEIRLVLYRDEAGVPYPEPVLVDVFDAATNQLPSAFMNLKSVINVEQPNLDVCSSATIDLSVIKQVYLDTINLPTIAGGYFLAYRACCRSVSIVNIEQALDAGAGMVLEITEASLNVCNTSPTFTNLPPTFFCAGQPFNFSQTAFDAEGDLLVYSICTPLSNEVNTLFSPPFAPVNLVSPTYSETNILGGGNPMTINASTGALSGIPEIIGQFAYGVCIKEYRNGELLSTVRLDFSMQVKPCFSPEALIIYQDPECNQLNIALDTGDVLSTSWDWSFINSNGVTVGTSTLENFLYTFPNFGDYTIQLIVNANSNCPDTAISTLTLYNFSSAQMPVLGAFNCNQGYGEQFINYPTDIANDPNVVSWAIGSISPVGDVNFVSGGDTLPPVLILEDGSYDLYYKIEYTNGCVVNTPILATPVYNIIQSEPNDTVLLCGLTLVELFDGNIFESDNVYNWTPGFGLNSTTIANPVLAVDQVTLPATYFVTITNSVGCSILDSVTVVDAPMENIEYLSTYCENGSIVQPLILPLDLLASPFVGIWNVMIYSPVVSDNTLIATLDSASDTLFYASGDDDHFIFFTVKMKYGCIYDYRDTIQYNTITEIPSETIIVCPNTPLVLNPSLGNEPDNVYQWANADLLDNSNAPNPTIINLDSIYSLYTVTITNDAGCEYVGNVQLVESINLPGSINVFGLQCTYPIILVATHPTGVYQIDWSLDPNFGTLLFAQDSTLEVPEALPSMLYYRLTPLVGCTLIDSIEPGIITNPTLELAILSGGCYNDSSIVVQAIPDAVGDFTINWISDNVITVLDSVSAGFNYEGGPINFTSFLSTSAGCVTQLTQQVNQIPPVIPDLTLVSNAELCSNLPIEVAWPASNDTLTAIWGPADAINLISDSLVGVTVGANPVWVTLQVSAPSGCVYNDSILVNLPQTTPTFSLNFAPPTCALDTAVLVTASTDAAAPFVLEWTPTDGLNPVSDTSTWVILQDTFINLTGTLTTQSGCVISEDVLLPAYEDYYLSATATATPDTVLLGQSAELNVSIAGSGQPTSVLWSPAASLDDPTVLQPIATPTETTVYTVAISNEDGCEAEATVALVVTAFNGSCDTPNVFLPNAFSPNSDGYNDTWRLYGTQSLIDCRIEVYSRLGELLFVSNSLDFEWEGNAKGRVLPPDAYAYILRYTCLSGGEFFRKGNVSLLR